MTRKTKTSPRAGFSLVEVVLAVGVISFAFVAIMGLIPAGLTQFRQAMDTSVGAQVAQRVIFDAEQTDFNTLVDYTNTQALEVPGQTFYFRGPTYQYSQAASSTGASPGACIRYFTEEGNEIIPAGRVSNPNCNPSGTELNNAVYYVNTRIATSTVLPQVNASPTTGSFDVATVLVQIAFNPGHRNIPLDTTGAFYVVGMNGIQVRNYSAQIGRNF